MSCWTRTRVLRIPAIFLGFEYWKEWDDFLEEHEEDFHWKPGCFSSAICCRLKEYPDWLYGIQNDCGPWDRLDMDLYPDRIKSVPGPFLDYCLEEIAPLPWEDCTLHKYDHARPLNEDEKIKYLPFYQKLFPAFTLENMKDVHYCCYEWYDGADAPYYY